jgi:chloride channel protein, CIC family
VLRQFFVHSLVARDVTPIREDASVAELMRAVSRSRHAAFPVVDGEERLVGMVGMDDLRAVLLESQSWATRTVGELVRRDIPVLRLGDSLFDALQLVVAHGIEEVVVVDDDHGRTVAGLLNRSELQSFYQKRLLAREGTG